MNELVSIVLAIYNGKKFLKETIDSLLNQTHENIEIIVVVNCTNDDTIKILESYEDERIKIFETNICQLAFNLNYGLLQSKGTYIVRIDSDDVAEPQRLEKQLKVLTEGDFDIVGSNLTYINENSLEIGEKKYPESDSKIRKTILYSSPLAHPSVIYKKSSVLKVGGYMNGKVSEDYDLWLRMMRDKTMKFYNIQENLTKYRIHSDQAKGNKLAYYEICGYMIREALYQKSFKYVIGFFVFLLKGLIK